MNEKKRILLIEDNPLNMKLAADLLEAEGYEVIKAEDGEKALSIIVNDIPHLILLDLQLPGIDGYEVLKKMRKNTNLADVKIIAVTASVMQSDQEKIRSAGFDEYISKPIDIDNFTQTIEALLGKEKQ